MLTGLLHMLKGREDHCFLLLMSNVQLLGQYGHHPVESVFALFVLQFLVKISHTARFCRADPGLPQEGVFPSTLYQANAYLMACILCGF